MSTSRLIEVWRLQESEMEERGEHETGTTRRVINSLLDSSISDPDLEILARIGEALMSWMLRLENML